MGSEKQRFHDWCEHAILDEYDKCLERDSRMAFCRAVGIDDNTIRLWVQQRESGDSD